MPMDEERIKQRQVVCPKFILYHTIHVLYGGAWCWCRALRQQRAIHNRLPPPSISLVCTMSLKNLSLLSGRVTRTLLLWTRAQQVGNSGGGKSTIAALLSRFYAPSRGDILIDGVDVTDLDRRWLTQRIAMVGQNPALFTGCVIAHFCAKAVLLEYRGIPGRGEQERERKRERRSQRGLKELKTYPRRWIDYCRLSGETAYVVPWWYR